jgi:hypothetical protein
VWHEAYDDPSSSLARRLGVVRRRLGAVLDAAAGERRQLLSLCAGDGRDVIPVLAARAAWLSSVSALLVEWNEGLSRRAADAASSSGLKAVEVRCADAGDPASFNDVLPVDVLLLCGTLGKHRAPVREGHGRGRARPARPGRIRDLDARCLRTRPTTRDPELVSRRRPGRGLVRRSPTTIGVGVNQLAPGLADARRHLPSHLSSFVPG